MYARHSIYSENNCPVYSVLLKQFAMDEINKNDFNGVGEIPKANYKGTIKVKDE
jgi:hypothetical protein